MTKESKATHLQHNIDDLKHDVAKIGNNISNLALKVVKIGKNEAGVVKDSLIDGSTKIAENVEGRLRKRPLVTLLGAFGIGILFGRLFRHNRNHRK